MSEWAREWIRRVTVGQVWIRSAEGWFRLLTERSHFSSIAVRSDSPVFIVKLSLELNGRVCKSNKSWSDLSQYFWKKGIFRSLKLGESEPDSMLSRGINKLGSDNGRWPGFWVIKAHCFENSSDIESIFVLIDAVAW